MTLTAELEPAVFDPEDDDEEVPFDLVDKCIIALHEKRGSTREAAMAALEGFVPIDDVDYRYLTVFARCCFSLKKGSAREAGLAYRAIGLLALTLGADCGGSKEILAEAFPLLVRTVQASSDGPRVVAALDCLAAVTFAGTRGDPDETSQSMTCVGVRPHHRRRVEDGPQHLETDLEGDHPAPRQASRGRRPRSPDGRRRGAGRVRGAQPDVARIPQGPVPADRRLHEARRVSGEVGVDVVEPARRAQGLDVGQAGAAQLPEAVPVSTATFKS